MSKKYSDPWVRTFTVTEPTRHKKGYTLYKVTSKVFPKNSVEAVTEVTVWKRYNDFKKLHKALYSLHQGLYLKGTFPQFAKAKFFGRFEDSVIEERRLCALELLAFAAKHSPLFTSQVFVKFFEDGQVVELTGKTDEPCTADILQPVSLVERSTSNESDASMQNPENTENSENTLGGIWQHRQAADEISITSQTSDCEDEDDRTTFTDDTETSATKPSLADLLEFDPLLESCGKTKQGTSSLSAELCHDWLLSAFQSFGPTKTEKLDTENLLVFPKPFDGLEDIDTTSNNTIDNRSVSSVSLSPVTTPVASTASDINEFDPIHCNLDVSLDKLSNANNTDLTNQQSYICEAGTFISSAQTAESTENYSRAFFCYKQGVDILLQGLASDTCPEQSIAVRKKVLQYLQRAEEIYENHLVEPKQLPNKPVV